MRKATIFRLAAVVGWSLSGTTGEAQQGYYHRVTTGTSGMVPTVSGTARDRDEPDLLLRPYGSPGRGRGEAWNDYRREPTAPPPDRSAPVIPPQRHNYFPSLRSGQAPNRNYVSPDRLCVPGRRPYMYR